MAPKDKGKKDKAPVEPVVQSLYQKREPLPPPEPPNVEEIEDAWKVAREAYLYPLPEFDAERVDTTDWNPNEVTTLYSSESFSAKLLPRQFVQQISTWKRVASVSDNTAQEEGAPEAKPPAPPPEPVVELDPKAKGKAKAEPKAKGKDTAPPTRPTTMQQFADVQYSGDATVVSSFEFRTRLVELTNDDGIPPLSQAIAAQISIIGEHGRLLPKGCFLWELIYPQNEDAMPLYNPHGKYVVKLFVHGQWREVMVDDIMPVGSATGSAALHAPILPASAAPNSLWPQILSKALLRAYNHDMRMPVIPAIQAFTGMYPFQMPFSWQCLRSLYDSRLFCCLQLASKVDMEARQREALMAASAEVDRKAQKDRKAAGGTATAIAVPSLNLGSGGIFNAAQAPKLGASPVDSLLQFLVCEIEEEPPQVRMKAAMWRPFGGTPRKAVLDVAESEGPDEEEDLPRTEQEDRVSDMDDHDDDDDEDRRSQRSPSGENTVPSARSKEDVNAGDETNGQAEETEEEKPAAIVWPSAMPASLMPKSLMKAYHQGLHGGYWVGGDVLQDVEVSCVCYMSPNARALSAVLDTTWGKRTDPYVPTSLRLLRLQLTSEEFSLDIEPTPRIQEEELGDPEVRERVIPWHKTAFVYEPLRLDPLAASAPITGPGGAACSCLLQRVNRWKSQEKTVEGPEYINLSVTENMGSSASRSVLLPQGEHWYLVSDDALRAGSVLSAVVDGATLNPSRSSAEFVDPSTFLPEQGIAMATVGTSEFPAQVGFSVWAKAEVNIRSLDSCESLELLTFISDPTLRPHLRLSLLRYEEESCDDPAQRCALWSKITTLTRVPLLPVMSLPLGKCEGQEDIFEAEGCSIKHILMLEANLPAISKGGTFSLQVLLPPQLSSAPTSASEEDETPPLELVDLKVDQVSRWSADVVPNEKGIILRERIVIPHGNGDVTGTIRVTVQGLPRAVLNAKLMAQLPPTQEMRPQVDGATLEPFAPGVPIDPKEYGGRQNWLDSKAIRASESGVERVMFPHVLLCEGSTYLLDVFVDPYKGPDKLDSGTWQLEIFGSGEVEMGADTMEQDLEELVRKSWETNEEGVAPRKERAERSRKRWMKKQGLLAADEDVEDEEPKAEPKAEAKAEAKAKAKSGKDAKGKQAQEEQEPVVNKEEQEAEWLNAALERAASQKHSNATVDEFVQVHTVIEPTLTEENPYTVAPVLHDTFEQNSDTNLRLYSDPAGVAINGLGMRGAAQVRQAEMEASIAKWEEIQNQVLAAKERNAQALSTLRTWSESTASIEAKFKELRENMRSGLQQRYQAKLALKDVVMDPEKVDVSALRTALEEAERQEVGVWDEELVATGTKKKTFIEDFEALKERLSKLEAEPLADEESRNALSQLSTSVGELQKELGKKIPLPPEMLDEDILRQTSEAIAASMEQPGEEAEAS
jgi:hypothetical protein